MTSREQQAVEVGEFRAIYKCRRCRNTYSGSRGTGRDMRDCLEAIAGNPSETAQAAWGTLDLAPLGVHLCHDGGLGISDLAGADPNG